MRLLATCCVVALLLAPVRPLAQLCGNTSLGFTPLIDQGPLYQGQSLGLYPGGANAMPSAHLAAGLTLANDVRPRNAQGVPKNNGRIGMAAIGMSNTRGEFQTFINQGPAPNPKVVFVNCAQNGEVARDWADPAHIVWANCDTAVATAGLTHAQVQVVWIKLTNSFPTQAWPDFAAELRDDLIATLALLEQRFPNLKLAYFSTRIYGGYSTDTRSPEPYAYETGYAVRWVIEQQLSGALPYSGTGRVSPWVAWGPYLWADGLTPNSDGLTWQCGDFQPDGTHPSTAGRQKVATRLRDFLLSDPTARPWFSGQ